MNTASTAAASLSGREDARAVFARHARTFHWASLFLGRSTAADVAAFYAFCRYVDDLADELGGYEARARLADVDWDLQRGASTTPVVAALLAVFERRSIDPRVVRLLVEGVASDLVPLRLSTADELVRYAYHVAGTVGLVSCALFDARDARAEPFAIDLGVAMQLTNVARDVLEDARRGRVYLPAELTGGPLEPDALVADLGDARARALDGVRRVLTRADAYYRSADRGMGFLPLRARAAALTASRCYEAIGRVIEERGPAYWKGRAFVATPGKLGHTLRALASLGAAAGRPAHDPELHAPLAGLPGADVPETAERSA